MDVTILGFRDGSATERIVNTTSRSSTWSRGLSPFFLGPVDLYGGFSAKNVENAWQYCKVYSKHLDGLGNPAPAYFAWAESGWRKAYADRYPMGKGAVPEYSFWDGQKLDCISARLKIYAPVYSRAVKCSPAFQKLQEYAANSQSVALLDFDGWNHDALGMSLEDAFLSSKKKLGHAFVLKALLVHGENFDRWLDALAARHQSSLVPKPRPSL